MENIITNIETSYNVNNYTDEELYDILDLDNPNDRVLEAKIIQMINKYSSIGGESGEKLSNFFIEIYNRFFYNSDDEDNRMDNEYNEESPDQQSSEYYREGYLDKLKNIFVADGKINLKEGLVNQVSLPNQEFITANDTGSALDAQNKQIVNIDISGTTNIMGNGTVGTKTETAQSKSIIVNQLDYRKDFLNPLLKQTVKRIISIDSQYRDTTFYPYSTNFTFNLSEPLRDVVAIRMYSMQIPYSWYTINNNYGGNFFYLKGNTAGIDNGRFDYKINVPSGNYLPAILTNAVNSSISALKSANTDVSFGNTSITYDGPSNKSSIFIDIKNNFNESDYTVNFDTTSGLNRFPLSTDSQGNFLKYQIDGNASISNYLGFNNISYSGNSILTVNTAGFSLGTSQQTQTEDSTVAKYTIVNNQNNYFTIYQYTGASYSDAVTNNTVLFNTKITLNLSGSVTRNAIVNEINAKMAINANLINSSIRRINITDANMQDFGLSIFKIDVNWDKHVIPTANILNTKTAIVFPNEVSGTGNRIWTMGDGINSANTCFYFPYNTMEVNEIYGETPINQTNYIINNNPTFKFVCTKPNYIGDKNDYTVTVSNSSANGYTLDEYLLAINDAINTTNQTSSNNSNINGIFNMNNTKILDDTTTQNKVSLIVDIAKSFTNIDGFIMDISESLLHTTYNFNSTYNNTISDFSAIDLSNTYILVGEIPQQNSYSYSGSILKIKPKYLSGSPTGVYNFGTWDINGTILGLNLDKFSTAIQNYIRTFSDDGETYPLSNSTFTYERLPGVTTIRFTLTLQINKILSEKDFQVEFIGDTWSNNLTFDISPDVYNLSDNTVLNQPYSQIFANSTLSGYAYYMDVAQTITIKAMSDGVVADDNSNDIILNIPVPTITNNGSNNYTIQQLFSLLNQQLTANSYTNGSLFSLIEYNGKKYVKLRLNINRLYTTNDYRVVFYDPFSFATCISGQNIATNVKWDSTLGWILGFREQTEYYLSEATATTRPNEKTLTGDTGVIISLYNYFLLVLDDYTQSHLNDGLITISKSYNDIPVFNSVVSNTFQCVDNGNTIAFTGTGTQVSNNKYTQKQIYAENQKYLSKKLKTSDYTTGPFANDVFALLPMKVTGLQVGATNVEFGGTLQNQERLYFGPVNIKRLSIKLLTDKGDVVDLNGQDWSFSFVCESLYQVKTVQNGGGAGAK